MTEKPPKVSVVMSVYNAENVLHRSIRSILGQSFDDFEFIIVNDGSEDDSLSIIQEHAEADARIVVIDQENLGLTKSLNLAVAAARGKYVARQDADDLSHPERLEMQVALLDSREDVVLVGTRHHSVVNGARRLVPGYGEDRINEMVYLVNPYAHTSVVFRKSVFDAVKGYDECFTCSQDSELWMRMARVGRISIVEKPLVDVYVRKGSIGSRRRFTQCLLSVWAKFKHPHRGYFLAVVYSIYRLGLACTPEFVYFLLDKRRRIGRGQ